MKLEALPPEKDLPAASHVGDVAVMESNPAATATPTVRKLPFHIPPILLEGDDSEPAPVNEAMQPFAPEAAAPAAPLETEGELPEAYGTRKLLLTARDPHWLYAHWDLTRKQQQEYGELSGDGHLTLRIYCENLLKQPVAEVSVPPDARHWFVHVERAASHYHAELGCQTAAGGWIPISTSLPALTPANRMSASTSVEFATIPFDTPMATLLALADGVAAQNLSLTGALEKLRALGHPDLPRLVPVAARTAEPERALTEVFNFENAREVSMGSLAISESVQPSLRELPTFQNLPASPAGISSPFGGGPVEKKFWFAVNAELIIYGATEPDAKVTIGGRVIPLRADGSFSYRFALPDGNFELPVVAISADQSDGRVAELNFTRDTETLGEVGIHPQDPQLKSPAPENL